MCRQGLWYAAWIAVAAAALAVRLPRLDRRPMHCDEANQARRAGLVFPETGRYDYDPRQHHGPSLCCLTQPFLRLSGARDFADTTASEYRIVTVLFGAALLLLLPLVADGLGAGPVLLAAIFMAVSPAMVYYSRYYIQETLLVFFTFAAIGCTWRYVRNGSLIWAAAAGTAFGLMHATKETWVLAAAAMVLGLAATIAWTRSREGHTLDPCPWLRPWAMLAFVTSGVVVAGLFYSSFGRSWQGPIDSVLAFKNYLHRGSTGDAIHAHPWYYYLHLLVAYHPARGFFWSEGLIVGLAAVGGCVGIFGRGHRLVRFLAFYTLFLVVIYSAIPYKTPWCLLSFLHAMTLLAGVGAWSILGTVPRCLGTVPVFAQRKWDCPLPKYHRCLSVGITALLAAALVAGVAHLSWETYWLNFRLPADSRNPWVYAHASSDVANLAAQLERLAAVSPQGHKMTIHVVTAENYWPLPWYLRRFDRDHVGYWQDATAWRTDTARQPPPAVILLTPEARPQVDAGLRGTYNQQMIYGLQPGVLLSVYVRDDLWRAFTSSQTRR